MAHVGILFCLYDHLKQLKEENIMAYMSEEGYKKLMAELKEAGYNKNRHSYLPLEVKLIFKYLGEP